MSINQQGSLNFPALDRYTWTAANFALFQTYIQAFHQELASANWTTGLIYGGGISVSSGLTISVAKLLALFSTSQIGTMDVSTIAVGAADPTNPRIDRIELGLVSTNNTTVQNIDGANVTLDFLVVPTLFVNPGTPAGSPSAPALTAGRLSLGLVTVNATQTVLTSASFAQSEVERTISRKNDPSELTFAMANNQSSFAVVQNLKLNSTLTRKATVKGYVYLVTGSNEALVDVTLECRFKPVGATWSLDATLDGPDLVTADGLEFTIDATGQIKYKTGNLAGSGYAGTFKFRVNPIS